MSTYMERYQEKQERIAALPVIVDSIERDVAYAFEPAFLREVEAVIEYVYLIIPTPLMARGYTQSSRLRLRKGRSNAWNIAVLFEGKYYTLYNPDDGIVQEATIFALDKCRIGSWVELAFAHKINRIGDVAAAYGSAVEYADTLHHRQAAQEANPTIGTVAYDALLADIAEVEARASELEVYYYGLGIDKKEGKYNGERSLCRY